MRRALVLTVGSTLLAAAACSLAVDTGGLAGGSSAGGTSTSSSTGGLSGASSSGASSSGASSSSGSVDAGPLDCTGALLCDDFESSTPNPVWTYHANGGSLLQIDGVKPRGGARSLHAARLDISAPNAAYIQAQVDVTYLACEVDAWAENLDAKEVAEVLTLQWGGVPGYGNVEPAYVFLTGEGILLGNIATLPDGGTPVDAQTSASIPGGGKERWVHLSLRVTSSGARLTYTPAGAAAGTLQLPVNLLPTAPRTNVYVGMVYTVNPAKPVTFVDNVRCTAP